MFNVHGLRAGRSRPYLDKKFSVVQVGAWFPRPVFYFPKLHEIENQQAGNQPGHDYFGVHTQKVMSFLEQTPKKSRILKAAPVGKKGCCRLILAILILNTIARKAQLC
jgi:hypothetical protein